MYASTHTDTAPDASSRWIQWIIEETEILEQLAQVARDSRGAAMKARDAALNQCLQEQSRLCEDLAALRTERDRQIEPSASGRADLLSVALTQTPKPRHRELLSRFARYVEAVECAQREIAVNRQFFEAALSAVEGTLHTIAQGGGATMLYDPAGLRGGELTALCLSTCT